MCVHIRLSLMMFEDLLRLCTGLCNSQEIYLRYILPETPVQVEVMDPYVTKLLFQEGTRAADVAAMECI